MSSARVSGILLLLNNLLDNRVGRGECGDIFHALRMDRRSPLVCAGVPRAARAVVSLSVLFRKAHLAHAADPVLSGHCARVLDDVSGGRVVAGCGHPHGRVHSVVRIVVHDLHVGDGYASFRLSGYRNFLS